MIDMRLKDLFFDTKAVRDRTDRATRRVLSKFGAFVRRTARSSIRKRKRISKPGSPPSSHTGLLKRFIWFGYDPQKESVVIGPIRLNRKRGDAPEALEYGGRSRLGPRRIVYIRERPFMRPAFVKEQNEHMPQMWYDSIR